MTRKARVAAGLAALSFVPAGAAFMNYPGRALPFWAMHALSVGMMLCCAAALSRSACCRLVDVLSSGTGSS